MEFNKLPEGCGAELCVDVADSAGLKEGDLMDVLVGLGRALDRMNGMFTEVLADFVSRTGRESAAWFLREYLRVSSLQARREVALAADLAENDLTDTITAMRQGEITTGHARVIATRAPQTGHKSERELLDLARDYAVDTCGRYTRGGEGLAFTEETTEKAAAEGPGDAEFRAQRADRRASLRLSPSDGMWVLSGRFDYLTGRRISQKFHAMVDSQRQDTTTGELSFPQRSADALAELATGESDHLRPKTSLLVVADYDVVADRLDNPRLDDGTPLPADLVAELAVNAKVLPAVFDANWSNLALGTGHRNANDAQKLVLAARDGGCVNCPAPAEATHAHHIDYWSRGGPTNIGNLTLLCPPCHNLIHDHGFQIRTGPDGRPRLHPPDHMHIPANSAGNPHGPAPPTAPGHGADPPNPAAPANTPGHLPRPPNTQAALAA